MFDGFKGIILEKIISFARRGKEGLGERENGSVGVGEAKDKYLFFSLFT